MLMDATLPLEKKNIFFIFYHYTHKKNNHLFVTPGKKPSRNHTLDIIFFKKKLQP